MADGTGSANSFLTTITLSGFSVSSTTALGSTTSEIDTETQASFGGGIVGLLTTPSVQEIISVAAQGDLGSLRLVSVVPPAPKTSQIVPPQNSSLAIVNSNNFYAIQAGHTLIFSVNLKSSQIIEINVVQSVFLADEDHTLRAWISRDYSGLPVSATVPYWSPNRRANKRVILYDPAKPNPNPNWPLVIPLSPSVYYLNIQNLENSNSAFFCTIAVKSNVPA